MATEDHYVTSINFPCLFCRQRRIIQGKKRVFFLDGNTSIQCVRQPVTYTGSLSWGQFRSQNQRCMHPLLENGEGKSSKIPHYNPHTVFGRPDPTKGWRRRPTLRGGTLLARYSFDHVAPSLACPVGRSVVNSARWTFLVAKTEVVIFHLLSCPPSLRVASSPLGMSRQTCAIILARVAALNCASVRLSLSQVARICVRIVFRSCRWDLHLVTESRIRCTDRTMSTCPSLPLGASG